MLSWVEHEKSFITSGPDDPKGALTTRPLLVIRSVLARHFQWVQHMVLWRNEKNIWLDELCIEHKNNNIPGLAILCFTDSGSFFLHFTISSSIFTILAGLRAHRQPFLVWVPVGLALSTFAKHLFKERLCRTEFWKIKIFEDLGRAQETTCVGNQPVFHSNLAVFKIQINHWLIVN